MQYIVLDLIRFSPLEIVCFFIAADEYFWSDEKENRRSDLNLAPKIAVSVGNKFTIDTFKSTVFKIWRNLIKTTGFSGFCFQNLLYILGSCVLDVLIL